MHVCSRLLIGLIMMFSSYSCQQTDTKSAITALRLNFQDGDVPSCHLFQTASHVRGRVLGKLLFEGLTRIDNTGKPILAGAKELHLSPDQKTYTFLLRDNHWSDGSAVTADHYVSAWRYALTPGSDCLRSDLFYLIKNGQKAKKGEVSIEQVGIQALDPTTLKVELENPSSYFLSLLAQSLFAPLKAPQEEPTTFNGPFKIKEWIKGKVIQLAANSYFWNCEQVQLNHITIDCVQDAMTNLYMYEKGQMDWIGDPFCPLQKESVLDLIKKKQAYSQPVDRFFWIFLNTHHPLLSSEKIRKALSLSIDRAQIVNHICIGGEPILAPLSEAMIPFSRDQIQEENLVLAQELFSEGLKEMGMDKMPPVVLSYTHDTPSRKQLTEYLKERWEDTFGFTIQIQGYDWNVYRSHLEHHNFEVGGCMESAFYGDPLEFFDRFVELSNSNFPQWESALFKEKISLIRKEPNEQKRMDLLVEAEKILLDQTPFIPVYRCTHVFAHHPSLKDYIIDNAGCVDFAYASFTKE